MSDRHPQKVELAAGDKVLVADNVLQLTPPYRPGGDGPTYYLSEVENIREVLLLRPATRGEVVEFIPTTEYDPDSPNVATGVYAYSGPWWMVLMNTGPIDKSGPIPLGMVNEDQVLAVYKASSVSQLFGSLSPIQTKAGRPRL